MTREDSKKPKKQMGVALPDYLRDKLAAASAAANVSIAAEIRRRLDNSFQSEALDDETYNLASAAIGIARDITAQAGPDWHATQKGRQAVAAGIRLWIEKMLLPVQPGAGEDLFGPDDPETLGRASARHYQQQVMKEYEDLDRPISRQDRLSIQWGKR